MVPSDRNPTPIEDSVAPAPGKAVWVPRTPHAAWLGFAQVGALCAAAPQTQPDVSSSGPSKSLLASEDRVPSLCSASRGQAGSWLHGHLKALLPKLL